MTAPDKIWVNLDDNTDGCCPVETDLNDVGKFFDASQAVAYIPEPVAQAAVAAALEAAAVACMMSHPDDDIYDLTVPAAKAACDTERATVACCQYDIRALITQPQHDALAAHVAAEVAKARADDAQAVKMLVLAAQTFCNRVEAGEIRSKRSYAMFKDALAQIGAKP